MLTDGGMAIYRDSARLRAMVNRGGVKVSNGLAGVGLYQAL